MNILIPDSWLREHLKTKATVKQLSEVLSLKSVSVERVNKVGEDFVYDIEVTTNRPDLMSVEGIAREANAALNSERIESKFAPINVKNIKEQNQTFPIKVNSDSKLVNRICAVVMEVKTSASPRFISDRLEKAGIRSLNNVIDVTNYVMKEVGHPTHVFDFDRLNTKSLLITTSQAGEEIKTLDEKNYKLLGDDIVAKDDNGRIVDLLGIMGTANSVVNQNTKRILFFVDNNNPLKIRNTSMNLGIRTEAAVLNEKALDPNLAIKALLRGIELYEKVAGAKVISSILDIYPNKSKDKEIKVSLEKINEVIGIEIPSKDSVKYLESLSFEVKQSNDSLTVKVPSFRTDLSIEEDVIEEIARMYGYFKLPSKIPAFFSDKPFNFYNSFYYESRIKMAMKYLGFDEVYTYSLVSEDKFEGPISEAIKIKNPLSIEMLYMRNSLIPSLLQIVNENKKREEIKIFEISNVYFKKGKDLPKENLMFSGIVKKTDINFFEVKGMIEEVLKDLGIKDLIFRNSKISAVGATIFAGKQDLGEIEVLDTNLIDFELNFEKILSLANMKKVYKPIAKFAAIEEDISVISSKPTQDLLNEIYAVDKLVKDVSLKDTYKDSRTFHITYQSEDNNLTKEEVSKIREKIIANLENKMSAKIRG